MDIQIYTMTHKPFEMPQGADRDLYKPLHVGRALGTDLGYPGDDTGDSISEKNRSFCELTGMYWLWKNLQCDYIGTAHYRRYMVEDENSNTILTKQKVQEWLSVYDLIVSMTIYIEGGNVWQYYQKWHHIKDLETVREVFAKMYPDQLSCFDVAMSCNLFCGGNMLITSKEIYDTYCEWIFPILFEAEKRIDTSTYDDYQKRVIGFLAERLMRVFLLSHGYKIKEAAVRTFE